MSTNVFRAAAAVAMLAGSSAQAFAQKTDVIILRNGDKITGEIVELDRGRLELKTDDAGTLEIEWEAIASLSATRQFELTTGDERRLLGALSPDPARARSLVLTSADGTATSLAWDEITGIQPIGRRFWSMLDGSFNAGFSYTRSSGVAQSYLNGDMVYRRPSFSMRLNGNATFTYRSDDDTGRSDQGSVEFSYIRYLRHRWFVNGLGRLETNESLGLVLRSQAGAALGQRLVNTNHAQLETGAGVAVNNEQGVDTPATQNIEGLVAVKWSYYTYNRPKTNLDTSLQYYPSFSVWGRQRLQVSAAVNRELFKDLFVGVNVYDSYDSAPPQAEAAHNDIGVTASVGWSFGR